MTTRVVMVTSPFPADSAGFLVDKFLGLVDAGFDVHVLTSEIGSIDRHPRLAQRWHEINHRIHGKSLRAVVPLLVRAALKPAISMRVALHEARRGRPTDWRLLNGLRLVSLDPDVVHFEFGWHAVQLSAAAELLNCSTVVSFRGSDANYVGLDDDDYYADVWARTDVIHCLGEDLWERVKTRGAPADQRHVIIAPAIDPNRFTPHQRGRHDGPLRLLSVGRLHWKKGHEFTIDAVAVLQKRGLDVELRIVGDGPHRDAIESAIRLHKLAASVQLSGGTDRDGVREAMQWADIFVHSAVSEGFCNAVLEAQAMELPVVTSDADGLAENVVDGQTGLVTTRRDPTSMAAQVLRLAEDPEMAASMGAAGRRRVLKSFTSTEQIAAFAELYEDLVATATQPGHSTAYPRLP